jgi:hypothetical protein
MLQKCYFLIEPRAFKRGCARQRVGVADASPEVRAVYDDIMATFKTDWVNNFRLGVAIGY